MSIFKQNIYKTLMIALPFLLATEAQSAEEMENDIEMNIPTSSTIVSSERTSSTLLAAQASSSTAFQPVSSSGWVSSMLTRTQSTVNPLSQCVWGTGKCIIETIQTPEFLIFATGTAFIVGGAVMIWDANVNHNVSYESYETTCTDDDEYYDDDYSNGQYHRHGHPNEHGCTKHECIGDGCVEQGFGIAFTIMGGICSLTSCAMVFNLGENSSRHHHGGGGRRHNSRFDSHHNYGFGS